MRRKALVVGVNHYPVNPLKSCIADAEQVGFLLQKNEDGSPNFDVEFMLSEKIVSGVPTKVFRDTLLTRIEQLFSGDADVALLYFSGHGCCKSGTNYIVTQDPSSTTPGIKLSDINEILLRSECKNKIVILDSCFSGQFGESAFTGTASQLPEGTTILTSSKKDETSAESPLLHHGLFTYLLLECLKGKSADLLGNVTPTSIYAYADRYLGSWEQRPIFKTNVQQFVSLRTVKPSIDVSELRSISTLFDSESHEFPLDPSYEFTNSPQDNHQLKEPYADEENVKTFKILQRFERVGLVEPIGEDHMYFAAMNSKSCCLTPLGQYYWSLAKKGRI